MSNKLYPRLLIHSVSASSALRCIAFRCILQMTVIYFDDSEWVNNEKGKIIANQWACMYIYTQNRQQIATTPRNSDLFVDEKKKKNEMFYSIFFQFICHIWSELAYVYAYVDVFVWECLCIVYFEKRRTTSVYVQGKKQAFFLWFFSACKQTNKQSAIKIQKRLYNAFDFILFAVYMFFYLLFPFISFIC